MPKLPNMLPPGWSRLPATRLTASSKYVVSVPFSPVLVPTRPYTAARGVRARSRASARTVSGSMPVRGSVASGLNGLANCSSQTAPSAWRASRARSARFSPNSTCSSDSSR